MATIASIDTSTLGAVGAVRDLVARMFSSGEIHSVFTSRHLPVQGAVMPALIASGESIDGIDPLSPAFPLNGAKLLSRLTKGATGGKRIAAVMRPCEIRAFVELVKLNQGSMDNVLLVSMDCYGAMTNETFRSFAAKGDTESFLTAMANGDGMDIAPACKACEHPTAEAADLVIGLAGVDTTRELLVLGNSARGEGLLTRLGLNDSGDGGPRQKALSEMIAARTAERDEMMERTRQATDSMPKLAEYLSACIGCYNCRAACPVCYCRECVFLTDVFDYRPEQYLGWAEKNGAIRLPTDIVFFHLTRLMHMSTSCVGCGQCSNACPNGVPVMELFRTTGHKTQQAFGYIPGRSPDEPQPLTVFNEKEFDEITE